MHIHPATAPRARRRSRPHGRPAGGPPGPTATRGQRTRQRMAAADHPAPPSSARRAAPRHAVVCRAAAMTSPGLPCRLVLPNGQLSCRDRPPEDHVRAYLYAVVAPQADIARYMEFPHGRRVNGELEVARWPNDNFHDPADRRAIYEHVMSRLERGDEMFCGPVPRTEPKPRKDAVQAGRVLWVDIDRKSDAPPPTQADIERLLAGGPDELHDGLLAAAALLGFPMPPHVVVFSGSGGAHGYWRVENTLRAEWIERANARLIHALGADWASFDRNRFLRMPGGVNGKNGRHCHLIHADLTSRAYDVRDLVGRLPDAPDDDPRAPKRIRRGQTQPSPRRTAISDPIDRWTPREYFAALCNITEYDRDQKVRCPLPDHTDPRPSVWIGDTPESGWFCFGCNRGGRVFDLASLLIGGPLGGGPRGGAVRAARAPLQRRPRGAVPPPGPGRAGRARAPPRRRDPRPVAELHFARPSHQSCPGPNPTRAPQPRAGHPPGAGSFPKGPACPRSRRRGGARHERTAPTRARRAR